MRRALVMTVAVICAIARPLAGQAQTASYVPGVFAGTPEGPIELRAWAEATTSGQLRMASGTLEDVPTLPEVQRILCNLPNWRPTFVLIASEAIFRDERAERRALPFAVRRINTSAIEVRIVDVERKDRLAARLRNVRASDQAPGYVFINMSSNGLERFYPFRVRPSRTK